MKQWITTRIELDTNKEEKFRYLFKTFNIDTNGNTLDETEYDVDANIMFKRIYRYFDTGEVEEYVEYDPKDELLERHHYTKNSDGEIIRIEEEFIDGQKSIKEFSFTDLGNASKAVIRDEDGEITGFEIYILNEQDQVKEEIELDEDENEISKFVKIYFEDGLIESEEQYRSGALYSKESFEYDEEDNLIKKVYSNYPDNFKIIENYEYNKNKVMIYNSAHQNGVLIFENICSYDENNNLISEEFFDLDYWERKIRRHEKLIHELKE